MKNAWALINPETGAVMGVGEGPLDQSLVGDARVVWRDTLAEIESLSAVQAPRKERAARQTMAAVGQIDRTNAKRTKARCARRFLRNVPEPAEIDPADPDAIPREYTELYDEYWATFDVTTTATDPWHLARLIVQKADEKRQAEREAASMAEAALRREKVIAEATIKQQKPTAPDE